MAIKPEIIDQWAEAIKEAEKAAIAASKDDDFGTCNFDSPTIDFTGWKEADISQLESKSGIRISDNLTSKMWKNHAFVHVSLHGQGNNRTRMAEAANKKLVELGLPATMYYQMD